MHRTIPAFSAVVVALAMLITACSGGNANSSAPAASGTPQPTGPPVEIKWYCCLGTGDDKTQLPVEAKVVDDFNKSQTHIKLVFDHVAYDGARAAFATRIASGTPPDVVGPLGVGGAEAFRGQWLDLKDLIAKNNVDLSVYGQGAVDFYKVAGQGQIGIPFAVYPSELYFQKDMFDEAGLSYPPQKYGDKYKMPDGTMVDWNYDTFRTIAMKLTVDANNKDATQPGFDPKHIVQYGFEPQRDDLRGMGAYFGAGKLAADDNKTVQIPTGWAYGWKWIYDGMFKDHFIMTNQVYKSTAFNGGGYAFNSGKVAMQENFLWNVCCVTDAGDNWDLGAIPANPTDNKVTAVFNADTFRITKGSLHPDEAFTVLQYLLGPASKTLLNSYSAFPARTADQADFFTGLQGQKTDKGKPVYPAKVDWQIAVDGIQYADNPNFEAWMPAYNKSLDLLTQKLTRWTSTPGLNMDQEISTLKTQLQAVWNNG
jgi:multiple sugar transport system substrate-binding protein